MGARSPTIWSERRGRLLLNLYPPFLFGRVRIVEIEDGFRRCVVEVRRSLLTRNLNGTIFGGTIFSAADPFYSVMFWQVFARRGQRVDVWLRSARIRYVKPARTTLRLEFRIPDEEVEEAAAALAGGTPFTKWHTIEAIDRAGETCAVAETEIYLRGSR